MAINFFDTLAHLCERRHLHILGIVHLTLGAAQLSVLVIVWSLSGLWLFKIMEFLFPAIIFGCLALTCGIAVLFVATTSTSTKNSTTKNFPSSAVRAETSKNNYCESNGSINKSSNYYQGILLPTPILPPRRSVLVVNGTHRQQPSSLVVNNEGDDETKIGSSNTFAGNYFNSNNQHRNSIVSIDNTAAEQQLLTGDFNQLSSSDDNNDISNTKQQRDQINFHSSSCTTEAMTTKSIPPLRCSLKLSSPPQKITNELTTTNLTTTTTTTDCIVPQAMHVRWSDLPPTVRQYSMKESLCTDSDDDDSERDFYKANATKEKPKNIALIVTVVISSFACIVFAIITARAITSDSERLRDSSSSSMPPEWWLDLQRQRKSSTAAAVTVDAARSAMLSFSTYYQTTSADHNTYYYDYIYAAMDNIPLDVQYRTAIAVNVCRVVLLLIVAAELVLALWTAVYCLLVEIVCLDCLERWWHIMSSHGRRRRARKHSNDILMAQRQQQHPRLKSSCWCTKSLCCCCAI